MKNINLYIFLIIVTALSCSYQRESVSRKDWYIKVESLIVSGNANNHFDGTIVIGSKAMLTNVSDGELIIALLSNIGDRTNELKLTKSIIKQVLK
jgi:hypothetical protein